MGAVCNIWGGVEGSRPLNPKAIWIFDPVQHVGNPATAAGATNVGWSIVDVVGMFIQATPFVLQDRTSALVRIGTYSTATNYKVTLNTVVFESGTGHTTKREALLAIQADIEAAASTDYDLHAALVDLDRDGTEETLWAWRKHDGEASGTLIMANGICTGGTGTFDWQYVDGDPSGSAFRLWAKLPDGDGFKIPMSWSPIFGASGSFENNGILDRLNMGGYERVYVQLVPATPSGNGDQVKGFIRVVIAPSLPKES